ncbi:hypothetical protein H8Z78_07745 [Dysosmobacter sp. NSJ-60]|uniref:Uncharacterized protein n=1 Tax=Pusillibacter faecalis TaxID=2714358 RepID=A0A810Q7M6_9FIRM|nr:hypothetical protein [Pusillibacter faecalis]MBC5747742.1 hypothetical protein [Dysosmobacter hominis]BCK84279.1 hypothetical protein MM59RIKEN_15980 [Pusillibacter faecalis]
MTESIIAALITGGLTLMGVLAANNKQQAITDTKLDELTREVREHNDFARRVPVVEEQIKVMNHRISDLEEYHK